MKRMLLLFDSFIIIIALLFFYPFRSAAESSYFTHEIKGEQVTWFFHESGDSTTTINIQDSMCTVDGTNITIDVYNLDEESDEALSDWMLEHPVNSLMFTDNIISIDSDIFSFRYFANASEIMFGENLQHIGNYAFSYNNAKSIILPEALTTIGKDAFECCTELKDITVLSRNVDLSDSGLGFGLNQQAMNGVTIRGYHASTAEIYAIENGFTFEALDESISTEHTTTTSQAITSYATQTTSITSTSITSSPKTGDNGIASVVLLAAITCGMSFSLLNKKKTDYIE